MTTKAQIQDKYGISMLIPPNIANKELTEKEADEYERLIKIIADNFDNWDEDCSGNID